MDEMYFSAWSKSWHLSLWCSIIERGNSLLIIFFTLKKIEQYSRRVICICLEKVIILSLNIVLQVLKSHWHQKFTKFKKKAMNLNLNHVPFGTQFFI
ncbi:hypothetical protein BpHYR1_018512 [Brachionus plicatilis]|uniref:Uncharacterized protein n=1 Tax=Brachionus plicatilis TaxID=10195 RepID=A0A3M7P2P4_BRAPC|nr:hypothetical protein BpHYR1_018512 [Brachionus plicatilis]